MKITLTQDEIEQSVREFVLKGISLSNGSAMTIEFSMGRGENGLSASIDIPYLGVTSLPINQAVPVQRAPQVAMQAAPAVVAKTDTTLLGKRATVVIVDDVAEASQADPEAAPFPDAPEPMAEGEAADPAATGRSLFAKS